MINREIKVKKVSEVRDPVTVWDTVLQNSSYTWYSGGYYHHKYAVIYSKSADRLIKDDSFFVYQNGELCGLVILVFTLSDEFDGIQGAYYSHHLPWPIIMDHVKDRDNIESFIFEKIDSRAKSFGAGKVQLCLNHPESNANCEKNYINVVRKFRYVDQSFYSHAINVTGETHSYVRKRYKRYVKKNWDKFEIRIIDQKNYR